MHDRETRGTFLVLFEHEDRGVVAVGCEGGDLAHAEFVAVSVGGAADVDAVREEGGQGLGLRVEGGVYGGCYEYFRDGWRRGGVEQRGEFCSEGFGGE